MSSVLYCCCSSAYIFTKKRTPSEENFNNYAKLPVTPKKTKALPKRNDSYSWRWRPLKGMISTKMNGFQ